MFYKKSRYRIGFTIVTSFVLIGCGGGDTTSVSTTPAQLTATLSGTVPGTLIEAFCEDGSYYKVASTQNGTSKHPFSITVPKELDCKIIMTTNEDKEVSQRIVTPIKFSNSSATSTNINLKDNVNIGYIPLPTTGRGIQPVLTVKVLDGKLEVRELSYDPLDSDRDGIPNIYEDDDNDGIYNKYDDDKDGDGIKDLEDSDYKNDKDGDGIDDEKDKDDDNDGIRDDIDDDDDNDGIKDKDDDHDDKKDQSVTVNQILPTTFSVNEGRLLGASCAQCHGTNGKSVNSWDSIAGENDLVEEFYEDENGLMSAVAHGFTRDEVEKIASWLRTLPKYSNDNDYDNDD